ncbi:acetyl-CoA carboxylase carboxyltransferase subunit alpha [Cyclobacterium marinum]|uniref:Acetyl-coenzyme A carboxylase carboxyl transferase subunit alpha n=1 Tax=Cyclobacterium marinum (strain ATCC 25205 / DSM 745 / LMG 13164 / NCIMB 1802) TaxID=880070 RepID=G0J336_CYCMS|nr:acetyl-CoA carboxylase carboxyltransferase subunit alpha [Cyclobacterium marinum]AEL28332.1 Acetyl-coenzyme A carboxylase carboxyl transferase subunit alpha [Cyclobacterium marinum DSM 745]MBI0398188.1 acetyl-CoA carboxylase carboxyltransferase subunit alpha [Cyclobacterium marinum]MBR9777005.1 acetyl-CoA carboxylase carboxyltransferase subunit alpha [Cytophagales bacterium]|tara:strand:+ start:12146 stop:13093 length:948 start_codon:yes stop_codon:yes gene_type:complete
MVLEFEKPIADLELKLQEMIQLANEKNIDLSSDIQSLEEKLQLLKKETFHNLTRWQRVQLSRHADRPYALDYIYEMTNDFIELHGDRTVKDDKAMIGGLGDIDGRSVMFIGQQKGRNTKLRQERNFGMANPEGYRKALRLMKMAEKFNKPIITLIDTPGAYPGIEAEERGQGEAIAKNLREMFKLKVPVICIIIGEGASGGALGIAIGDKVMMLENSWYSVISPENCSTILWRSWDHKEQAAEALKLTGTDMKNNGLVDAIIEEPLGGAHRNMSDMAARIKAKIKEALVELDKMKVDKRIEKRIEKFCAMGIVQE